MMNREQGYTLVELLVTIAITGIIFTAVGSIMFQLTRVSGDGNDRLTAIHDLQNAAYWFNLDGQEAVTASGTSSLNLSLPSGKTIIYSLSGSNLQRNDGISIIAVARNISQVAFTTQGKLVYMNITSSPPGKTNITEQGTYEVCLRPVTP